MSRLRMVCLLLALTVGSGCGSGVTSSVEDLPAGADVSPADTLASDFRVPPSDLSDRFSAGEGVLPDSSRIPPGFGNPCASNADCESGLCVEVGEGESVCTIPCVEECPKDWLCKGIETPPDWTFICVPPGGNACKPCDADSDCLYKGDLCLPVGASGTFCALDCAGGEPCPEHYTCADVPLESGTARQCLPDTGSCICSFGIDGAAEACSVTNELGKCFGERFCNGAAGWSECNAKTPAAETCDGTDEDCDGQVDEGLQPTACSKSNENGECLGTLTCDGPNGWVCDAPTPLPEDCDGLDNDCDGIADDGLGDQPELCDGVDNDCDGLVDEGFKDTDFDKTADCADPDDDDDLDPDESDCSPLDPLVHAGAVEECDGIDNNCDYFADEGCPASGLALQQVQAAGTVKSKNIALTVTFEAVAGGRVQGSDLVLELGW